MSMLFLHCLLSLHGTAADVVTKGRFSAHGEKLRRLAT